MNRASEIKESIHKLLIELCAIADESDQIVDANIKTYYLNSAGKVQCNAVLDCDIKLIDKGEL